MDKDTYRVAQMIQELGRKAFRSPFGVEVQTIPEHCATGLGEPDAPDGAAYLACLFLASSIDRGQEDVVPLITHNQGGPIGVAGGPRSVAYWLTFSSNARFVDPEATALILKSWAWKRRRSPKPMRQPTVNGFSETALGDPLLGASTDPILEIEQAMLVPGTLDQPLVEPEQRFQFSYQQVISATLLPPESWAKHPELIKQAISAWGKVAPVVPQQVSNDVRTRAGWVFLRHLVEFAESGASHALIASTLQPQSLARRELRRIATDFDLYRSPRLPFHD